MAVQIHLRFKGFPAGTRLNGSGPNYSMVDKNQIREHLEVVGSDGNHVGTVDHLDGDSIRLTKTDPAAGGQHHWISASLVDSIDGQKVRLSVTTAEANENLSTASPSARV